MCTQQFEHQEFQAIEVFFCMRGGGITPVQGASVKLNTLCFIKFPVVALKLKLVSVLFPLEPGSNFGKGRVWECTFSAIFGQKGSFLGYFLARRVEIFP